MPHSENHHYKTHGTCKHEGSSLLRVRHYLWRPISGENRGLGVTNEPLTSPKLQCAEIQSAGYQSSYFGGDIDLFSSSVLASLQHPFVLIRHASHTTNMASIARCMRVARPSALSALRQPAVARPAPRFNVTRAFSASAISKADDTLSTPNVRPPRPDPPSPPTKPPSLFSQQHGSLCLTCHAFVCVCLNRPYPQIYQRP